MPAWGSTTEARDALRAFVSDGAQDRPVKGKLVIGPADGVNIVFYTWEERIVGSIVFSLNGVEQAPGIVASQDLVMGRFVLATAPTANTEIRARYYWQLFLDDDLDEALRQAAGEIHETDEITSVEPGLKFTSLHYAAAFAFTKQYTRWMIQRSSEKFLLVERPVEDGARGMADAFKDAADRYYKMAGELRLAYYERHGRRAAPAFTVYKPRIPAIGPQR
jgi:hypothetical protein